MFIYKFKYIYIYSHIYVQIYLHIYIYALCNYYVIRIKYLTFPNVSCNCKLCIYTNERKCVCLSNNKLKLTTCFAEMNECFELTFALLALTNENDVLAELLKLLEDWFELKLGDRLVIIDKADEDKIAPLLSDITS